MEVGLKLLDDGALEYFLRHEQRDESEGRVRCRLERAPRHE